MNEFDEILDKSAMPEPPTSAYSNALERLDGVVRTAIALSRSCGGIPSESGRHYYASVLFTTLLVRSVSLLQIAPLSNWAAKVIEHWDYASCSVIARTILEIRLCFYYLCVDQCDDDEWKCRWEAMNIHDCAHRIKIFEALGQEGEAAEHRKVMDRLIERIASNEHFKTLDSGRQKNIAKGKLAYLKSLEEIAEQAGLTVSEFRFFHVFFSTHVHGLPMSFYRVGEARGRGLPTEVESNYTAMCLELTASLVASCHAEIEDLFKDAMKSHHAAVEAATNVPEALPEFNEMIEGLAMGEIKRVYESERVRIDAFGMSNREAALLFFEPTMGEKILRMSVTAGGDSIAFIDPVYWNIDVNDEPVTDRLLDELIKAEHLFKIDVVAKRLRFKAPIEAVKRVRETLAEIIKTEPQFPRVELPDDSG